MSVVMVVNEKWRERVPAWGTFEALPDRFPSFFQRVLDASLSPLEVSNSDTYTQCVTVCIVGFRVHHEGEDHATSVPGLLLQQSGRTSIIL